MGSGEYRCKYCGRRKRFDGNLGTESGHKDGVLSLINVEPVPQKRRSQPTIPYDGHRGRTIDMVVSDTRMILSHLIDGADDWQ